MKYLARIFGKRIETQNEFCHFVSYFWRGRLYHWKRDFYYQPHLGDPGPP
jgi:hypothetical protein